MKKLVVELDYSEVQEILAINQGEDAERALTFIKKNLATQVKGFPEPSSEPIVEASYGPREKDRFGY
ncbi:MAG: hypothetical protein JSU72_10955 [Deltaproteobacteria bacterium]|nr:MAG: hypothetical protein JSU72_10955 [Deltaproteobacteria bacterium]